MGPIPLKSLICQRKVLFRVIYFWLAKNCIVARRLNPRQFISQAQDDGNFSTEEEEGKKETEI